MRRILSVFLLLFVIPTVAFATWQPAEPVADGTADAVVLFHTEAAIAAGADGASSVQVKNSGEGVLTVSLWRYSGTAWTSVLPYNALTGEAFYAIVIMGANHHQIDH